MINIYRYITMSIDMQKFLDDTRNHFIFISQRQYKGKQDANGQVIIEPGTTVTLQVVEDHSDPGKDKEGRIRDNNALETFDATIVGCQYPLSFKKGQQVKLTGFLPDISYYIDYSPILRFSGIEPAENGKARE